MELIDYAKSELDRISKDEDGIQDMINNNVLDIIEKFSDQGHSGTSAGYFISTLNRLLRFKPIMPLTGEDDEWEERSFGGSRQNKRCSSVFQREDGTAYDNDAVVVSDNGGITWFTSKQFSKGDIRFPYFPPIEPEAVYIEYLGSEKVCYEIITDKPERIKALRERKRKEFDAVYYGETV